MPAIAVRPVGPRDAAAVLAVHRAAVHGRAGTHYPPAILDAWSPRPVTAAAVQRYLDNADGELRLLAEIDGRAVGFGAIVPALGELRACYVAPEAAGCGVGTALLGALEYEARRLGVTRLALDASLNAADFYRAHGYAEDGRGLHVLFGGQRMACIAMHKLL